MPWPPGDIASDRHPPRPTNAIAEAIIAYALRLDSLFFLRMTLAEDATTGTLLN